MELVSLLVTAISIVTYIVAGIFIFCAIIALGLLGFCIHLILQERREKKLNALYSDRRTAP